MLAKRDRLSALAKVGNPTKSNHQSDQIQPVIQVNPTKKSDQIRPNQTKSK